MKYLKTITLPLYQCKIKLNISSTINKEINNAYIKNKLKPIDVGNVYGVVIGFDIDTYYIFLNSNFPLTHGTLAHEILHLVESISKERDVLEEESKAWLCGYITDEIYNYLELKNIQIGRTRSK